MIQSINAQVKNIYQNASSCLPSKEQLKAVTLVAITIASLAVIIISANKVVFVASGMFFSIMVDILKDDDKFLDNILKTTAIVAVSSAAILGTTSLISNHVLNFASDHFIPIIGLKEILTDRNLLEEVIKQYQIAKELNI